MVTDYCPLDSLKEVAIIVGEIIEQVQDTLVGNEQLYDDDPAIELLDSARRELTLALARHIPGITWQKVTAVYGREAAAAARTFDDGTPVRRLVALADWGDEYLVCYSPRRDGPLPEFKERMLAARRNQVMRLVPDVEPDLVNSVESALQQLNDGEDG